MGTNAVVEESATTLGEALQTIADELADIGEMKGDRRQIADRLNARMLEAGKARLAAKDPRERRRIEARVIILAAAIGLLSRRI